MTINEQVSLSLARVDNQIVYYVQELTDFKKNIASGLISNNPYVEWLDGLLMGLKNAKFELEEIEKCLLEER